jgi:actin-related protein
MEVDGEGVYRAGTQALEIRRDGMEVVSPFENGILKEWDAVEALWDHTFK